MTAKRTPKKSTAKTRASASAGAETAKKKAAVKKAKTAKPASRKEAKKAKKAKTVKTAKKSPARAKATKARTTRQAASKKAAGKAARGRAPKAKRKPGAKRTGRRPPLNLRGFRRRLLGMQADLLQAYMNVKGDSRSRTSDGTEDYIDYAVSSYDREFLLSLTELERNRLNLVDEALQRIDRGGFGLCTQCNHVIPVKRLEVQPWARYCLRCQELADAGLTDGSFDLSSDDDEVEAADEIDDAEPDEAADDDGTPDESTLVSG
jgi:DnaK suppressor protein